jgi:hypothetical protein
MYSSLIQVGFVETKTEMQAQIIVIHFASVKSLLRVLSCTFNKKGWRVESPAFWLCCAAKF